MIVFNLILKVAQKPVSSECPWKPLLGMSRLLFLHVLMGLSF